MKKTLFRKMTALLLAVITTLCFVGCAKEFDASAYMKAELDLLTKHDLEQYMDVIGVSETEAMEIYEESMSGITASLEDLRTAGLPEDLISEYELWMIDLIVNTKYTVLEASKDGDAYIVPVEVEPVRAFANVSESLETQLSAYMEDLIADMMAGGAQPSEEEMNLWVYQTLLDIVKANLDNPQYGEKQTFNITIEKNSDGLYEPNEEQTMELGMNLLDLSDIEDLM